MHLRPMTTAPEELILDCVETRVGLGANAMARRYLAFDIETAKEIPGEDFNWRPHRPLGITCAATLTSDSNELRLWHGNPSDGEPAPRMSRDDTLRVVEFLSKMAKDGFTILTWNGVGFDLDILAEESGAAAACQECALAHVDMMFHALCTLGYPVGLDKAAQGMGLPGKPAGMSGLQAPRLWADKRYDEVLAYVSGDARTTIQVAQATESQSRMDWITRKGTKSTMPLPKGWLTVREALGLPEPDTSWMPNPLKRSSFTSWLPAQQ